MAADLMNLNSQMLNLNSHPGGYAKPNPAVKRLGTYSRSWGS